MAPKPGRAEARLSEQRDLADQGACRTWMPVFLIILYLMPLPKRYKTIPLP